MWKSPLQRKNSATPHRLSHPRPDPPPQRGYKGPYAPENLQNILRLIAKVITVSVETIEIVETLPELGFDKDTMEGQSAPQRIQSAKGDDPFVGTCEFGKERDKMVYNLYGMMEDETVVVEGMA